MIDINKTSTVAGQTRWSNVDIFIVPPLPSTCTSSLLCCHGAFLNLPKILFLSLFGFSIGLSSVSVTAIMMDLVVWRTGNDEGVSHFTEPHLGTLPWLWDSLCIFSPCALPAPSSLSSKIFSYAQERCA